MKKQYRYEAEPQANGGMIFMRYVKHGGKTWTRYGAPKLVTDKELQMGDIPALWEDDDIRREGW